MNDTNINETTLTKKSQFYYDLPESLIAQKPIEPRDSSRLMVLYKNSDAILHKKFYDIIDFLNPGDCLILNNSKVLPARIFGKNIATEYIVEFLLLKQHEKNIWETLVKPGKKAKIGFEFIFGDKNSDFLKAKIADILPDGNRLIEFENTTNFFDKLDKIGQMPLPPYIKEKLKDKSRYQTVYAKDLGSAAAPTAGLHFTPELLQKIKDKGVNIGFVTLHVGLGTFRPVKEDDISNHKMHSEYFVMPEETAELINNTKKLGKKVISVGTTSCRVIESIFQKLGKIDAYEGETDIFIRPGYKFGVMDGLITNFHLPESTLIMLVSAFAGYNKTMNAYHVAVSEKYRFFSFGDAMMII
ncbi:MAG: tRNA preQ1(34) S-adenosylmethionine ribosyltransferase-isomerase QueA [Clostridia bacterium]|nr:tRNA preQ1(34) S-adenosylmethionine ribosyltransferase-isomerase QueA [Clostridia bacterium]